MKINQPVTDTEKEARKKSHRLLVQRQKKYFRQLADRIEAGEELDEFDSLLASRAVRNAANNIDDEWKAPSGRKVFIRDTVRFDYAKLRVIHGLSSGKAIAELCVMHGKPEGPVDPSAIKKHLGQNKSVPDFEKLKAEVEFFKNLFKGVKSNSGD